MKCCMLYEDLRGSIQFYIIKKFYMVLGRAKVWVESHFFLKI